MKALPSTDAARQVKLQVLAEAEGFDSVDEMFAATMTDSVLPGICTEPSCDYTTEVEPDQDQGWCEACNKQTVASALILGGLI